MPFFRKSDFRTDCDRCGVRFEPGSGGGVCPSCKAILCNRHLHGDLAQRVRTWMGAPTVCVRCRNAESPASNVERNRGTPPR